MIREIDALFVLLIHILIKKWKDVKIAPQVPTLWKEKQIGLPASLWNLANVRIWKLNSVIAQKIKEKKNTYGNSQKFVMIIVLILSNFLKNLMFPVEAVEKDNLWIQRTNVNIVPQGLIKILITIKQTQKDKFVHVNLVLLAPLPLGIKRSTISKNGLNYLVECVQLQVKLDILKLVWKTLVGSSIKMEI